MSRMLTYREAETFYDRFGKKQDNQNWYEGAAVDALCTHAAFDQADAVFEFGCGTGKLAHKLLDDFLPVSSRYVGLELSQTMVDLSRRRLNGFMQRATIIKSDGAMTLAQPDKAYDRFLSCYVLDLLSDADAHAILAEAYRILHPEGLIAIASLARGPSFPSNIVSAVWAGVHRLKPDLVGGCRPIDVRGLLAPRDWHVEHHEIIAPYGVPSEVVVARKRAYA